MARRWLFLVALGCGFTVVLPSRAAVPVAVIEGKGFGHGVGMAQDGAYWMGKAGKSTPQILGHFYPGTGLGRGRGPVRVAVHSAPTREAVLSFPNGGEVRDALSGRQSPGFPVRVNPGGEVLIRFDGSRYSAHPLGGASISAMASPRLTRIAYRQEPTTTTTQPPPTILPTTSTTAPPIPEQTTTTAPPSPEQPPPPPPPSPPPPSASSARPLWGIAAGSGTVSVPARGRNYRGVIEATAAAGPLRLLNQVDVEEYLKGMGEVRDPRWPPASLRAQAIAARTYALRAMATAGELCDTQKCQVYLGAAAEYGAMNKAVADSDGQVILFGRGLASAVYSANGGGFSANEQEGFGTDDAGYSYLRAAPYETRDPLPWTVRVALSDLGGRFGYGGQVTGVRVSKLGPSGRALEVTLDGTAGPKVVPGIAFDAGLGLKSTLFTIKLEQADVAPPPPPPGEGQQALPDAAALAAGAAEAVPTPPWIAPSSKPLRAGGADDGVPVALGAVAVLANIAAAAASAFRFRFGPGRV